ncbi:MAG: endolytic transglycosylase MltG [Myxococcota bacterium]
MKRAAWVSFGVLLMFCLACAGLVSPDTPIDPGDTTPIVVEVPKGSTPGSIAGLALEHGFIGSELEWKAYVRTKDLSCLKAGRFEVRRSMSLNEFAETLCGPPLTNEFTFTVLEGWRIRDTDAALAAEGLIKPGAYADLAFNKKVEAPFPIEGTTLEGYLWPETYRLNADGFEPSQLIQRQLATFKKRFLDSHTDYGKRTLHEIVTMASMLEREEPKPSNRPLVAGILWKRIDRSIPLGVDATSRYELEKWNDRKAFLARLRNKSDPYNSRYIEGLPPTPIGAPTLPSLTAAMNPTPTNALYYLHDHEGNLHPARNGEEHEANRKRYNVY